MDEMFYVLEREGKQTKQSNAFLHSLLSGKHKCLVIISDLLSTLQLKFKDATERLSLRIVSLRCYRSKYISLKEECV